jgi:hypothetical protein
VRVKLSPDAEQFGLDVLGNILEVAMILGALCLVFRLNIPVIYLAAGFGFTFRGLVDSSDTILFLPIKWALRRFGWQ